MKKCAILTMDNTEGHIIYDHLLAAPLKDAGWHCDTVSWRAEVDWDQYHLVMIRSPWDYQLDAPGFLKVLETIDNSSARLDNPLDIVRWNINKLYLQELNEKGVAILPTLWRDTFSEKDFLTAFDTLATQEIVVKPCISAGAHDTFRINRDHAQSMLAKLQRKYQRRDFMLQAFSPEIVAEGEFSIFYFDDEYSHTILKTPKENDFRVQEEFGGLLQKVAPEQGLMRAAKKVLAAVDQSLLYARLDFVRYGDHFALMEAELIEPSLYFNLDSEAPRRYVEAMERRMLRLGII